MKDRKILIEIKSMTFGIQIKRILLSLISGFVLVSMFRKISEVLYGLSLILQKVT